MFRLEERVTAWCLAIHPRGLDRQARVDELADHLYCEVERWKSEGYSEEEAFRAATHQLGDADELTREHAGNTGGLLRALRVLLALGACSPTALSGLLTPKQASALLLGVSMAFAAAMLTSSALLGDSRHAPTLVFGLIALWWVPFSVLSHVASGAHRRSCRRTVEPR